MFEWYGSTVIVCGLNLEEQNHQECYRTYLVDLVVVGEEGGYHHIRGYIEQFSE